MNALGADISLVEQSTEELLERCSGPTASTYGLADVECNARFS